MNNGEDYSDPMHIYNVRARRAADQAERDLFAEIEPRPRNTIMSVLKRALQEGTDDSETAR